MQLEEVARVGMVDDLELVVFTDDPGKIPHFHLRDRATRSEVFHSCIRLDMPSYFPHNGKFSILNSKQRKSLVNFLKSKSARGLTNWEIVLTMWNLNNLDVYVDDTAEMPDYNKL